MSYRNPIWEMAIYKDIKPKRPPRPLNIRTNGDGSIANQWAIRHIPTGNFMPEPVGYNGRGGSHWEHTGGQANIIRLFKTKRAATNALSAWLQGKFYGDYDGGVDVSKVSDRKREEMEIVEMQLIPKENKHEPYP